jgi:hypothetical protein
LIRVHFAFIGLLQHCAHTIISARKQQWNYVAKPKANIQFTVRNRSLSAQRSKFATDE